MNIDVLWFFQIFLAGFVTVWTFRFFTNRTTKYAEFEWFALSGFWGLFVIATIQSIPHMQEQWATQFANPLVMGFTLSFFGMFIGYCGSRIVRWRLFRWLLKFLGRNGGDGSGKIF